MNQIILSAISGLIVGGIFSFLNLPIPAPPTLSGIVGIIGIYLGFVIINVTL
jgi:XapX domain-containing protein